MARSGSNYMPFAMGNQLRNLGYLTKAYHNHTYTYYKRDVSHPNLGYDYKGVGNGLEVRKSWPESDLEMIEVTVDEYIDHQPFHRILHDRERTYELQFLWKSDGQQKQGVCGASAVL